MRRTLVLAAAVAVVTSSWGAQPGVAAPSAERPNIVVIVSDDQRWDTFTPAYMPLTSEFFRSNGVVYTNSFVPNPLCCPSRASTLTGTYSHTTGVYGNGRPHGGFRAFDDEVTIATALQDTGYRTLFVGKYLNGYPGRHWSYVPPGWERWYAVGTGSYYNYPVANNGRKTARFGTRSRDYSGRVLTRRASAYIEGTDGSTPYLLVFGPVAPHRSNDRYPEARALPVPDVRDVRRFRNEPIWRPASYGPSSVDDMPRYVRRASWSRSLRERIDRFRAAQLESIYSMDRQIARVIAAADAKDAGLGNTIVVFTSDNGYLWGEHTVRTKRVPYEESIRVPLAIHYPDGTVGVDARLALNVDIAPTVLAAAGLDPSTTPTAIDSYGTGGVAVPPEGIDLRTTERTSFLLEHWDHSPKVPGYCGVRTAEGYTYVRYWDPRDEADLGFEELYDVSRDPLQLENRAGDPPYASTVETLRELTEASCQPAPPHYAWP